MKVTYFQNSLGACDFYRCVLPLEKAAERSFFDLKRLWPANILFDIHYKPELFQESMKSDIFFFQRVIGRDFMSRMIEIIRKESKSSRIIMDEDDNCFAVNPLSNHYVDFGTKEFKIESNGKVIFEWKDGVNIDIKANIKRMDEIKRGLSLCDAITVTTDILAEAYRPYNDNVRVLPNCVDLKAWPRPKFLRENPDEVRISWSGGHSHWEDLFMVRDAIKEIVRKNKNVKFIVCGYLPEGMKEDFPPNQFEHHNWCDISGHSYRMALLDSDISLIPLKDSEFNRCKSPIKWVEMSALSVPSVSSLVSPYKELISLSETDNGVYIEDNDIGAWINGVQALIDDKNLRESIGKSANLVVKNYFDVNTQYHQWVNTFSEVLACQSHLTPH